MKIVNWIWICARILFGLFFIYAALMVVVIYDGMNPPETLKPASDFARALDSTGFMNPLIIGSMIVAGAALLFTRTAPLGLIMLAPSIVVIACFHWFLTGNYVWGTIWPVWFLLLVWRFREVFSRLWAVKSEG